MPSQELENLLPPIEYIYEEFDDDDDDEDDEDEVTIEFIYPCDKYECDKVDSVKDIELNYITADFNTHVSPTCYVSVLTLVTDFQLSNPVSDEIHLDRVYGAVVLHRFEVGAVSVRLVYDPGISISEMLIFKH